LSPIHGHVSKKLPRLLPIGILNRDRLPDSRQPEPVSKSDPFMYNHPHPLLIRSDDMNRQLLLEYEFGRQTAKTEQPTLEQVLSRLRQMHIGMRRSFCILSDDTGSYVQCAGTPRRLIIEHRHVEGERFGHVVLGLNPEDRRDAYVRYSGGLIRLKQNEVLTVEHAAEVFSSFFHKGTIPKRYVLRYITEEFLDLP
jgi:hypothetical protein